jgi:hypothetical protein
MQLRQKSGLIGFDISVRFLLRIDRAHFSIFLRLLSIFELGFLQITQKSQFARPPPLGQFHRVSPVSAATIVWTIKNTFSKTTEIRWK